MADVREQLAALEARVQQLEAERDAALRGEWADYAVEALWKRLGEIDPKLFAAARSPGAASLPRAMETYGEFVELLMRIDHHILDMLSKLRNSNDPEDKLNDPYQTLDETPNIGEATRDFLLTGRTKNFYLNNVRARVAWGLAFARGAFDAVIESHLKIKDSLNYKVWPIPGKRAGSEIPDAAVGKYFKETVQETLADRLGTDLRKLAADRSFDHYSQYV